MTENCPVCDSKIVDKDVVKVIRERFRDGFTPASPLDHTLMELAIREIERLRENVKSMTGQLAYIGDLGTAMADSVKRNCRIDGGWEP